MTKCGLIANVIGGGRFYSQFGEKRRGISSMLTLAAGFFQAVSWKKEDELWLCTTVKAPLSF